MDYQIISEVVKKIPSNGSGKFFFVGVLEVGVGSVVKRFFYFQ